jgi:hypothetical protein
MVGTTSARECDGERNHGIYLFRTIKGAAGSTKTRQHILSQLVEVLNKIQQVCGTDNSHSSQSLTLATSHL